MQVALAVRIEHAQRDDLRVRGDAAEVVTVSRDETRHECPVAARVERARSVVHEVDTRDDGAGEVRMRRDPGVHERDRHAPTGCLGPGLFCLQDLIRGARLDVVVLVVRIASSFGDLGVRRDEVDADVGAKRVEDAGAQLRGDQVDRREGADVARARGARGEGDGVRRPVTHADEGVAGGIESRIDGHGGPIDAWDGREADKEGNDDGDARAPQSLTRSSCHFPQNSQPEYYLLAQWRSSPVRVMFT